MQSQPLGSITTWDDLVSKFLNKKLEKLEIAAVGTQLAPQAAWGLCGGPHENHNCNLILDDQSSTEQ
ncbi:hypothetical protein PIB30_085751, partial [Stylosanthes scabra]|nr:hypothetical protein [Stylosanthes scabra]